MTTNEHQTLRMPDERVTMTTETSYPDNWNEYPAPHYDEDGSCQCPDHQMMRESEESRFSTVHRFIAGSRPGSVDRGLQQTNPAPMQRMRETRIGRSLQRP